MRHRQSGQASAEYVAVVAVVALVLGIAGTAVAATDVPRAVVRALQTALCIAGGDVCRPVDAAARGLEPCVNDSAERARDTSVTIGVWRAGHGRSYTVARRSDGTVSVSGSDDGHVSRSLTMGLGLGADVRAGASGTAAIRFTRGREWIFEDLAAARDFLRRVDDPMHLSDDGDVYRATGLPAPIRYREGGGELGASLSAEVGASRVATSLTGVDASLRVALGRRIAPDGTTLYYDISAETSGLLADALPALGRSGHVALEWHDARPPVVTLRSFATAPESRTVDTRLRLALTDPGDREAALDLAVAPLTGPAAALAAREFVRRVQDRGTIERDTYAEERDEGGFDATVRVGAGLGVDHTSTAIRRRLVAAEVVAGGRAAQRIDCLGLDRS